MFALLQYFYNEFLFIFSFRLLVENIDESILVINLTSHLDKHYPHLNNNTTDIIINKN